jgi:cytochrome c biogenesis protein
VFVGDLGIDDGVPRSVYTLDTSAMTQLTGPVAGTDSIELVPGESAELPNGWGTVTFEDESAGANLQESVKRFASLDIKRDVGSTWVLLFAVLATFGLIAALLIPRRRIWVKASSAHAEGTLRLEHAGLARGEDPQLADALAQIQNAHLAALTTDQLPAPISPRNNR